jgi:hypothetical protein
MKMKQSRQILQKGAWVEATKGCDINQGETTA